MVAEDGNAANRSRLPNVHGTSHTLWKFTSSSEYLGLGLDVNELVNDQYPICLAILNGEEEIALHLLLNGADLQLPEIPKCQKKFKPQKDVLLKLVVFQILLHIIIHYFVVVSPMFFPASVVHHIQKALSPSNPSGSEMVGRIITSVISPSKSEHNPLIFRHTEAERVWVLLVAYGASQMMDGSPRAFADTILFQSWKSAFFRTLVSVLVDKLVRVFGTAKHEIKRSRSAGLEVAEAFLNSAFKTERLLLTILDQGLLSRKYVEASLNSDDSLVARLCVVAIREGYETADVNLLYSGFQLI